MPDSPAVYGGTCWLHQDALGTRLVVPLRMLEDIKTALQLGTAWIHSRALHLAVPSRYLQQILNRSRLITLTDATSRLLLRALADHYQPLPISTPNLQIYLHIDRRHGKTSVGSPRELADLVQAMEAKVARHGVGQVEVLTHQALAHPARQQVKVGLLLLSKIEGIHLNWDTFCRLNAKCRRGCRHSQGRIVPP